MSDKSERNSIIKLVKKGGRKKDIDTIVEFVKENGGLKYAEEIARKYSSDAIHCMGSYPDTPVKKSLVDLVKFVIEREK